MSRAVKLKIHWNKRNGQMILCPSKKKLPVISKDAKYLKMRYEGWE